MTDIREDLADLHPEPSQHSSDTQPTMDKYLRPSAMLDSGHPAVIRFAEQALGHAEVDPIHAAVRLYYAVRDGIRYDPYVAFHRPADYQASRIIKLGRGYCVGKAALLCALARARNIPCRLGFATVRNHLASKKLIDHIGSDRFVFHGYVEFLLNRRWIKATPAFNAELCDLHHVDPLEFDGCSDAVYQSFNRNDELYMEYLADHGTYDDVPVDTIVNAWKGAYGHRRVQGWIDKNERQAEGARRSDSDFYHEPPLH
jgi:transglutaminase-like putative cysteine protease